MGGGRWEVGGGVVWERAGAPASLAGSANLEEHKNAKQQKL